MDGASLATGRALWINPGQVLYKTITLERGPEEMDYEDIQLRLISECDTTAFDLVNISAHFIPSCSDVHIAAPADQRSEEHTSELQSLMRISYAVFCLKK